MKEIIEPSWPFLCPQDEMEPLREYPPDIPGCEAKVVGLQLRYPKVISKQELRLLKYNLIWKNGPIWNKKK
jgi:hypothetical protein